MNRKSFLLKTAGTLLLAAPAYALLSCSSSDDSNNNTSPPGGNADCLANGTTSSIGTNHGHTLTVSTADVNAGVEKTYSIAGSAGHGHSVTLTAANFNALQSNQQVSVNSTSGAGHTHSVTVRCA